MAGRTLTKAVGDPGQIAAAHLYLMENDYVTGTVLTVDGGLLLASPRLGQESARTSGADQPVRATSPCSKIVVPT